MPLSAVPYKLSITYIHLFLSRYQYPVFHRSFVHFQSVMAEKNKAILECQGTDFTGNLTKILSVSLLFLFLYIYF